MYQTTIYGWFLRPHWYQRWKECKWGKRCWDDSFQGSTRKDSARKEIHFALQLFSLVIFVWPSFFRLSKGFKWIFFSQSQNCLKGAKKVVLQTLHSHMCLKFCAFPFGHKTFGHILGLSCQSQNVLVLALRKFQSQNIALQTNEQESKKWYFQLKQLVIRAF